MMKHTDMSQSFTLQPGIAGVILPSEKKKEYIEIEIPVV